ncbi:hypothetical protein ACIQTZ_07950 [Paenarthrobacter sp. NPDC090520]|uniref:hypothetical protein n=1 Tax=Paenarthrobacter sp. NPDC090520 TaxID=3364382 RepID=UPI0038306BB5
MTYNVVAEVDNGVQNTFPLVMDQNAHLAKAKAGSRQVSEVDQATTAAKPATLSSASLARKPGCSHHEWQNRGKGTLNEVDVRNNFHDSDMNIINRFKDDLSNGKPVDLSWSMELKRSDDASVPSSVRLEHSFGAEDPVVARYDNLLAAGKFRA